MATSFQSVVLLTADVVSFAGAFLSPWGVFLNGVQVIGQGVAGVAFALLGAGSTNMLDLDYRTRMVIANYPVEQGAFQSYNKVQTPYDVAITVSAGGTDINRQLLLAQVEGIIGSLELFTVVMPETGITSLNPVGYSYRRTHDRGLGLLTIEIFFQQVRPAGDPTFSNTSSPTSSAAPVGSGNAPPIISNSTSPPYNTQQNFGTQSPSAGP